MLTLIPLKIFLEVFLGFLAAILHILPYTPLDVQFFPYSFFFKY